MDRNLGHDRLMTLALKLEAAARDRDRVRLRAEVAAFLLALEEHLAAEVPAFLPLSPSDARLLKRGQRRLWAATRLLVQQSGCGGEGSTGAAVDRAQELRALLELQAHDEYRAFRPAA